MTIHTDIRGAIQTKAATVSGFPASVQYEGRVFDPPKTSTWARITIIPSSERPPVLSGVVMLEGIAQIDIFTPSKGGPGTNSIETLVDSIKTTFTPGLRIPSASGRVQIRYSERGPLIAEPDWLHIPVSIGYRTYDAV